MSPQVFSQSGYTPGIKQQSEFEGYAVTPSDATDLQFRTYSTVGGAHAYEACTAIYVTGAGNVNVNLASGGTAVLTGLSAGQIVRVNASRILSTSTTATGIFALYPAGSL
jgi:hypothetical protein